VPLIRQLEAIADAFDVDLAVFFNRPTRPASRTARPAQRRPAGPDRLVTAASAADEEE
jgi:hypothetical protein